MIKIKNWSSLQSYKDRTPPWIRFHKSMLDNYEYHMMSANARALLPMLWLLASEDSDPVSGCIRDRYEKIVFRLRMSMNDFLSGLEECAQGGFLIIEKSLPQPIEKQACNESVTTSLRNRNQSVTPETETETETETERESGAYAYARTHTQDLQIKNPTEVTMQKLQGWLDQKKAQAYAFTIDLEMEIENIANHFESTALQNQYGQKIYKNSAGAVIHDFLPIFKKLLLKANENHKVTQYQQSFKRQTAPPWEMDNRKQNYAAADQALAEYMAEQEALKDKK